MAAGETDRTRKAIAMLRRRPEVRSLALLARTQDNPAWIVGGAVRDAALGIPVPEIDVAVGRDAEGLARALEEAGLGTAVFLSRDRPGPRVYRVAGRRPIDIAEIEGGSIDADLARRDFTANAIAVGLEDGSIRDPFGGLQDLVRRRLRCVRVRNLEEDPLRALRAARFLATHGLSPDDETLAAARRYASGLRRVARERVGVELSKLLEAPAAQPAFAWAVRAGLLPAALGLALSPSDRARAARSLAPLDRPAIRRLPPERRRRLRLARLAIALGLSPARRVRWLRDLRLPRRDTQSVLELATLAAAVADVSSRRDAVAWLLAAGAQAPDALRLASLSGPTNTRRAKRIQRLGLVPLRRVPVTGSDVVGWLSIPPGPPVGIWLERLRLEAALGTVRNRREARHWLRGQARVSP
jgi:tRNA nucleotidyltransferase/poly(A) polymerase